MKLLWSGTWNSGSITVPELPYYNVFLFKLLNTVTLVPGFGLPPNGDKYIRGSNIQQTEHGNVVIYGVNVVVNGTTLNVDAQESGCPGFSVYNHDAAAVYTDRSVVKIYGWL